MGQAVRSGPLFPNAAKSPHGIGAGAFLTAALALEGVFAVGASPRVELYGHSVSLAGFVWIFVAILSASVFTWGIQLVTEWLYGWHTSLTMMRVTEGVGLAAMFIWVCAIGSCCWSV